MHHLENLTLILNSYACDKGCPFCIAKNNKKFVGTNESFEGLPILFKKLEQANIQFNRFVVSGNGEPSLYRKEQLLQIIEAIQMYPTLFSEVRLHTSGNIFFDEEKLKLFQDAFDNRLEIDFFRLSLDSKEDMESLGYSRDYINSPLFQTAKRIKMDIGLTPLLDSSQFAKDLTICLQTHPNIRTVRFKKLMRGENETSPQAQWVEHHTLPRQEMINLAYGLTQCYGSDTYTEFETPDGVTIKFEKTGNYTKDIVLSNGVLQSYDESELEIEDLIQISDRDMKNKYLDFSIEK